MGGGPVGGGPVVGSLGVVRYQVGGGHYGPLMFFSFWATKRPKLKLCTFLALKLTRIAILNSFRLLSVATRVRQILVDIIVETFKIFKILSFKGVMHLK